MANKAIEYKNQRTKKLPTYMIFFILTNIYELNMCQRIQLLNKSYGINGMDKKKKVFNCHYFLTLEMSSDRQRTITRVSIERPKSKINPPKHLEDYV